ncbi:hypothetical protein O987_18220 [Comamonas testosteroni TK102]|uniref:Tetratricopeptide repeat protein n=2 Tax=Comamonadaceae TaxID=80864 RepID=A0A076PPS4_COMTE|nr:hypothetical protein O987_18220 [Comamonas testosteroni TK102]MPS87431.1 hypothetical protein [Comamonas sp.]
MDLHMLARRTARGFQALAVAAASMSLGAAAKPDAGFQTRFAPLYATVFSEGGSFSGRAMSADLQALEPLLKKPGVVARDAFRLYYTQASVYARRGMSKEAAKAASTALTALPAPQTDPELSYAQFFLRYSSIRWLADAGQHAAALKQVKALQAQYPLQQIAGLPAEMRWDESAKPARALDFPSQMQILGIYEDEGYLLHELGRFREARQANERLLPVARERLNDMGKLQQIRGVLTNIAQNCYELGDLKQAGAYLQERLQIAQTAQDHASVYDSYFQLMVLAHEQKQEPQARQWLARYEQYALDQKDSEQQTRARELLTELEQRTTGHRP